jgi:hypothetical protein
MIRRRCGKRSGVDGARVAREDQNLDTENTEKRRRKIGDGNGFYSGGVEEDELTDFFQEGGQGVGGELGGVEGGRG